MFAEEVDLLLQEFGIPRHSYTRGERAVTSPLTGTTIARVQDASSEDVTAAVSRAKTAFQAWRDELSAALVPMFADLSEDELAAMRSTVEIIASRVDLSNAASAALAGSR